MTDKPQRPESFEFALDFLGDPEASELRAYIEQLEARAALAQPEHEVAGLTLQLPEQAPDEHPPSNLDRREIAAWYHGHACGWQAARAVLARWGRPAPAPAGEVGEGVTMAELIAFTRSQSPWQAWMEADGCLANAHCEIAELLHAVLARYGHQPAPPAEVAPGSAIEDVGPLITWLTEQAHQAADASQPTDAGMLTWAAQVIGERVDEDAPAPPAAGEAGELVRWLRGANWDGKRQSLATRAADLLERQAAPVLEPALARINDILNDSGRILQTDELEALELARQALEQRHPAPVPVAIPGEEYHEDMGAVTWWRFPVDEPPWVGTPNESDWPGYHTHFTPAPPEPAPALPLPSGEVK